MTEQLSNFQEEIRVLEAKLDAKKKEMAATGVESPESHVFKSVIRQHSGHEPLIDAAQGSKVPAQPATASLSSDDEQRIDELVLHAFTKGIKAAIQEAKRTNSAYLIDALHDRLADEYYQKLLESRKVNAE